MHSSCTLLQIKETKKENKTQCINIEHLLLNKFSTICDDNFLCRFSGFCSTRLKKCRFQRMSVFTKLFSLLTLVLCTVTGNIPNKLSDGVETNVDKSCVLWLWIWFVDSNTILLLMHLRTLFCPVFEILVTCIESLVFGSPYLAKVTASLFTIYFF